MRALSATLTTAQKTHSATPIVRLKLDDRHCGAPRYHFTKVREDGSLPNNHCASVTWSTYLGLLTTTAANVPTFYRYAAGATPGAPLVVTLTGAAVANSQLALIYEGTTLWAFHIGTTYHLYYATSTDDGATWSAWTDFYATAAGTTITNLAVAKGNGTYCTWVLLCDSTTAGITTIWTFFRVGTTIYGPYAWTRAAPTATRGLATHYLSGGVDWTLIAFFLAGRTEGSTLETIRRYTLQVASPTSRLWTYTSPVIAGDHPNFLWASPNVVYGDAIDRTFLLAQETSPVSTYPVLIPIRPGTAFYGSGAATRRPLPALGSKTLALVLATTGLQYGNPSAIFHAPAYAAASRVDLTDNLISYRFTEALPPYSEPSMATFVLGSKDVYMDLPTGLTPGAQLMLEEGYVTTAGAEYSQLPPFYVHSVTRSPHQIVIRAYDTWTKLARQSADFSATYQTSPVILLDTLCHLIGIPYDDDDSANLFVALTPPTFTVVHGQSLASLIARILTYTGCALIFKAPTPATYPSVQLYVFTPPTATAGAYAYGPTTHRILDWMIDDADPQATWMIALFESTYGEAFDLAEIDALGFASQLSHYDPNWKGTSDILPADAAALLLTFAQHRQREGSITVRPNVGTEPGDVISISAAPLSGTAASLSTYASTHYQVTGNYTAYATARSTSTYFYDSAMTPAIGQSLTGDWYAVNRLFLKFDTTSIPQHATITSATLTLTPMYVSYNLAFDIDLLAQHWSPQDPITDANRETAYDNCLALTASSIWANTADLAANTPKATAIATSIVSPEDITYLSLRSATDKAGVPPTDENEVGFYPYDAANPAYRPTLTVTYTLLCRRITAITHAYDTRRGPDYTHTYDLASLPS